MSFCPCIRTWFSICQVHRSFAPPTQAWPLRVLWLSGSFATQTQNGSKNLTTSPLLPAGPHPISYGAPPDLPVLSWASLKFSMEHWSDCAAAKSKNSMPSIPSTTGSSNACHSKDGGRWVFRHDFIDSLQNNMFKLCQKLFNSWN